MLNSDKEKMINGMKLMKEACNAVGDWAGCTTCPFDSYCTALQRAAIELYKEDSYEPWCPIDWYPDGLEEKEKEK